MLSAPKRPSTCDPVPRYACTARSAKRPSATRACASAASRWLRVSASFRSVRASRYFASLYCSASTSKSCSSPASFCLAASTSFADGAAREERLSTDRTTGSAKSTATTSRVIRVRVPVMRSFVRTIERLRRRSRRPRLPGPAYVVKPLVLRLSEMRRAGRCGPPFPIGVGTAGLEPATSASRTLRATKLRHVPSVSV